MAKFFIEGLPCAGKSTLVKQIEQISDLPVIHELGRVIPTDSFPGNGKTIEDILKIDDWFIEKESSRSVGHSGYFDRSFFTHLVYSFAYGNYTQNKSFEPTVRKYMDAIDSGRLPLPDKLIYLDIPPEESINRQLKRVRLGRRALDSFWSDRSFLSDTKKAYESLIGSISGIDILVVDGRRSPESKLEEVITNTMPATTLGTISRKAINLIDYIDNLSRSNK